ncbi:Probable diaminopimelate epimerase (DapF epimerase) [Mycobacteroides abscessus subsp. abscessus]|nr:Probable diaminopimelate epimerase (DapF epimerase) [Mycobacteroides abscessus subsp. abscessus]HEO8422368.1 diaminopimelate epimerase [Yersinia enterocolitica]
MNIKITKCHGSGNDFLIIDEISDAYQFSEEERAELAKALCNRTSSLGADGILYVMPSQVADARMRVFNADGSEASMCGNGIRCVARYVCELLQVEEALIETMKANLEVKNEAEIYPNIPTYLVEISPVSFQTKDLPLYVESDTLLNEKIPGLHEDLLFTALAVPNPHLITIVNKDVLDSNVQEILSKYVNGANEYFPDGVNVSFVSILEKGSIYVRTYERGVGFTNACGTAMSASTLVSILNGYNEENRYVDVYNNGGKVRCYVHHQDNQYRIDLIGNATYVFHAVVSIDWDAIESFEVGEKTYYEEEAIQYKKLQDDAKKYVEDHLK